MPAAAAGERQPQTEDDRAPTTTEIEALYRYWSSRLQKIVRMDVRGADAVVEDACQFAWGSLLDHRDRVRSDGAMAWVTTTAIRYAVQLVRRANRCQSLEQGLETGDEFAHHSDEDPARLLEERERLALVRSLPARQQRLLWLQALGLSYAEMALHVGCTVRTIERQLLRAKSALREAEAAPLFREAEASVVVSRALAAPPAADRMPRSAPAAEFRTRPPA